MITSLCTTAIAVLTISQRGCQPDSVNVFRANHVVVKPEPASCKNEYLLLFDEWVRRPFPGARLPDVISWPVVATEEWFDHLVFDVLRQFPQIPEQRAAEARALFLSSPDGSLGEISSERFAAGSPNALLAASWSSVLRDAKRWTFVTTESGLVLCMHMHSNLFSVTLIDFANHNAQRVYILISDVQGPCDSAELCDCVRKIRRLWASTQSAVLGGAN